MGSAPETDPVLAGVRRLGDGFAAVGWQVTGGDPGAPWAFVARTSLFRWRWMATRMHIFVFGVPIYDGVHPQWLDEQLAAAVQYSRVNKTGLPAGFQTGTATMLVGVGSGLNPGVQPWASQVHGRKYAAVTLPVLGDLATGHVTIPGRPVMGAIYHGYLKDVAERFVGAAVRPQ
jgi:hypothetical protein